MGDSLDPNEAAGKIAKEIMNSEPVTNLLGPLTTNIGAVLGLVGDIARFYTEENLAKIFCKWGQRIRGEPLNAEDFKRVLPLLRDAAMQSDEELQERWAALLESFVTAEQPLSPSFGFTLSQLTPVEARFLGRLAIIVHVRTMGAPGEYFYHQLLTLYDESIPSDIIGSEGLIDAMPLDLQAQAEFAISHLMMLNLIQKRAEAITTGGGYGARPDTTTLEWYSVSVYGRQFHEAVSGQ